MSGMTSFLKNGAACSAKATGSFSQHPSISYFSAFKTSQRFSSKIRRDAFTNPKQMFVFFPSQNSAWQEISQCSPSRLISQNQTPWSCSRAAEARAAAEVFPCTEWILSHCAMAVPGAVAVHHHNVGLWVPELSSSTGNALARHSSTVLLQAGILPCSIFSIFLCADI